jgi:glyoxylase-like metal-dependent hydrolase (beta-lactamase superfamily II)
MNKRSPLILSLTTAAMLLLLSLESQAIQAPQISTVSQDAKVGFAIVHTGQSGLTPEALLVSGGSWFNLRNLVQNAVLIRHPKGDVMIDAGLGQKIDEQFSENSFAMRQLFAYENLNPAIDQYAQAAYDALEVKKIIPTHLHWDHASGIVDFPKAKVWVQKPEYEEATEGSAPAHLQSQLNSPDTQWHFFELDNKAHLGYSKSLDVYGDGSIVLVDLKGHSAGQVGIFLTISSGKQYFFVGDTTWTIKGVQDNAPRSEVLKWLVEVNWDTEKNTQKISQLNDFYQANQDIVMVPAHDETLMKNLPLFPDFQY